MEINVCGRRIKAINLNYGQSCFVSSVRRSFGQLSTGQQHSRLRTEAKGRLKPSLWMDDVHTYFYYPINCSPFIKLALRGSRWFGVLATSFSWPRLIKAGDQSSPSPPGLPADSVRSVHSFVAEFGRQKSEREGRDLE